MGDQPAKVLIGSTGVPCPKAAVTVQISAQPPVGACVLASAHLHSNKLICQVSSAPEPLAFLPFFLTTTSSARPFLDNAERSTTSPARSPGICLTACSKRADNEQRDVYSDLC